MSPDLKGKVILITGAARRTGRALALGLAEAGADIIIHYRSSEKEANSLKKEIEAKGGRAQYIAADLSLMDEVIGFCAVIKAKLKRLDVIINNVGNYPKKPLLDTSIYEFQQLLRINLMAPMVLAQQLSPLLASSKEAHIINLGSAGVEYALVNAKAPAYQITKQALLQLTRVLASELGGQGIRVNMVSPGHLDNSVDMSADTVADAPLGRVGTLDDLLAAVLYLLRPDSYSTGTNLEVTGGYRQSL